MAPLFDHPSARFTTQSDVLRRGGEYNEVVGLGVLLVPMVQ